MGEKSGAKEKKTVKRRLPVSKTRIETAIRDLLEKWEADGGRAKPAVSVADFIRLVQLQKELKAEQRPKEIKVTWVEPEEKDPDPEN